MVNAERYYEMQQVNLALLQLGDLSGAYDLSNVVLSPVEQARYIELYCKE